MNNDATEEFDSTDVDWRETARTLQEEVTRLRAAEAEPVHIDPLLLERIEDLAKGESEPEDGWRIGRDLLAALSPLPKDIPSDDNLWGVRRAVRAIAHNRPTGSNDMAALEALGRVVERMERARATPAATKDVWGHT